MKQPNRAKNILTKLDRIITSILLLIMVLIALYVSIARQLIGWLDDYKLQLATILSETLHTPVTIGELKGSWGILSPHIKVTNIHIGNKEQSLKIDKLIIELDIPRSILKQRVQVAAIYGDNVNLQIRENQPNDWSIGGIPPQKDPITPAIVLNQLQRFQKISVTNSTISIFAYNQPVHTFTHVNATLTHFTDEQMKLDGIFYINDNSPLVLSIDTLINPQKWQELKATFYANIPNINWLAWIPKDLDLPWDIKQLILGGELWGNVRGGQIRSLTFNTKQSLLTIQHDKKNTVHIKDIAMQGWFNHYKQQYIGMQIANLSFSTNDIPFNNLDLSLTRHEVNDQIQWHAKANKIAISDFIPPILALAPIPSTANDIIVAMQPKGLIKNLDIDWYPDKPLTEQVNFSAQLEKVTFNPYKDTVGAGNISGTIHGGIASGQLDLDANDFWLFIAKIYAKAWPFHHAKASLHWSFKDNVFSLFSPLMKLKGDEGDLSGDMMIRLYPQDDIKDYMDLRVNIANGDASYTSKYIPSKADMDPQLVNWLNTSIKSGNITTGFFQYQGSLDKRTAPTAHTLLLYMKTNNAVVDYQAPWPAVQNVDGEIFIEPSGVRVLASQGKINNTLLANINVNVPLVAKPAITHLYFNAEINSKIDDLLSVLKSAPVEISNIFKEWQGSGQLQGLLKLNIPLVKHQDPLIITDFSVTGGQLKSNQFPLPPITNIIGDFHYDSSKGLSSDKVTGYILGQPLLALITAEGKGKPSSLLNIKGSIDLPMLANWYDGQKKQWPFSGKTPYEVKLKIADSNEVTITSQLKGITLDLPSPFTKSASQEQDFTYHSTFGNKQNTRLQFNYGNLITSAIELDKQHTFAGEILINQGKASFSNKLGLQVRGNLDSINLGEWKDFYDNYVAKYTLTKSNKAFNIHALRSLDLRIGQAYGFNFPSQPLALYLQPTGQHGWRLDVNSSSLAGRITAPQVNNLPYYINLKYLKIPKETLAKIATPQSKTINTFNLNSIPNSNLFIENLFINDDLIGTIQFKNTSSNSGLQVSNINLNLRGLYIKGNLDWQLGKQTTFNGQLSGKNIENILKNWGIKPSITAKSFNAFITGSWPGDPTNLSLTNFTGKINSQFKTGRLLTVDDSSTNILRVFGILNSESITRRLRLDFSDLFKSGLTYDHIKGEFTSQNGIYQTSIPFELEGPSMLMSMAGQLNMNNQQISAILRVGVPLGSNISLATLAVAPPIGGAMLIVDHFFGNQLMKLAAVTYNIQGDWNNPSITLSTPINK